jgi:hypothetical protein
MNKPTSGENLEDEYVFTALRFKVSPTHNNQNYFRGFFYSGYELSKAKIDDLETKLASQFDLGYKTGVNESLGEIKRLRGQAEEAIETIKNLIEDIDTPSRLGLDKPVNPDWTSYNEARDFLTKWEVEK